MDITALEGLGKVAGIAGIAIGALVLIFSSVIRKNIFPQLESKQAYSILKLIIICSFLFGIAGLITYSIAKPNEKEGQNKLVVLGVVKDADEQPIPNVVVTIPEEPNLSARSDSRGQYRLTLTGKGKSFYDFEYKSSGHQPLRLGIPVDFESEGDIFYLDEVKMSTKKQLAEVERILHPPTSSSNHEERNGLNQPANKENLDGGVAGGPVPGEESFGNNKSVSGQSIMVYDGGNILGLNCDLSKVTMTLGEKEFKLSSLPQKVSIGTGSYDLITEGKISCQGQVYEVSYFNELYVYSGLNYYAYWYINDFGGIDMGLATEAELAILRGMGF